MVGHSNEVVFVQGSVSVFLGFDDEIREVQVPVKREIKKPLFFKWLRKDTSTATPLEKSHVCAPGITTISMCAPSCHNNFKLMQPSVT